MESQISNVLVMFFLCNFPKEKVVLIAAIDKHLSWYIARSAGLISWAVITASIVWGLALSTRLIRKKGAPAWLLDLHRYLGTLSIIFTLIHVVSLLFDTFAHLSIAELLIPFASPKRPGYLPNALAWGIVGFYFLLAIQFTSWAKKYLPRNLWHTVHLGSFPLFALGTIHGFKAGSEHSNRLVIWSAMVGGIIFFFLFLFRMFSLTGEPEERPSRITRTPKAEAGVATITAPSEDDERAKRIAALRSGQKTPTRARVHRDADGSIVPVAEALDTDSPALATERSARAPRAADPTDPSAPARSRIPRAAKPEAGPDEQIQNAAPTAREAGVREAAVGEAVVRGAAVDEAAWAESNS
jgi:predicted ferric reductase